MGTNTELGYSLIAVTDIAVDDSVEVRETLRVTGEGVDAVWGSESGMEGSVAVVTLEGIGTGMGISGVNFMIDEDRDVEVGSAGVAVEAGIGVGLGVIEWE